jgi:hypothetical protein
MKRPIWGSVWKGTSRERHPTVLAQLPRIGRRGLVFTTDGECLLGGFSKFESKP